MSAETLKAIRDGQFELDVSDKRPKLIGLLILFVTFGMFGTWAAVAPLDSAALAPGVVTVKTYRKTIQHLEGGIVEAIHVRDGDQVAEGDVLLVLDDTQARAELEIVRGQLIAARALEARLQAERDQKGNVAFPAAFDLNDPRVAESVQSEEQVFQARMNSHLGEIDVLEQRMTQISEQVRGLESVIQSKKALKASFKDEAAELEELLSEGFVDKQRLRDLERRVSELEGEIADHRSSIAQAKMKKGETRLSILQLKKDFHTEVVNQLAEVQSKLFDLKERERALVDRVERTLIRAPETGMVLGMKVHTVGGVVQSGAPILDIVPAASDLVVEAQVSPIDIDRVSAGKLADIRFSAFKSATTPIIEGQVEHISADRLTNEENGMPYYLARVALTEKGRRDLGELVLVPGMPAEVLINTGERTLLEYLVQPATNAFARSFIED
ncbi:HlyD family type I secretion periplasmic adaptor subunit [Marinobacterium sp. AK62]|uniref:Membrane fusion protein (MFP) family protein n=1 Tax=Marinobacterium alkalitolerans TaxID=1542925 RepID=A0ABS3ZEH5_9GAMM|nr:HlyD family type I secretion periplasmic adaptor subunit [Marinobacterium alkalitolerans]MBP0049710.1 HlyD family type I secretion periplasmic adaptor subunit [Marinobacterium alkalitolerans]